MRGDILLWNLSYPYDESSLYIINLILYHGLYASHRYNYAHKNLGIFSQMCNNSIEKTMRVHGRKE